MLHTPLRASGKDILDADGMWIATAKDPATAIAIVQFVNATAAT